MDINSFAILDEADPRRLAVVSPLLSTPKAKRRKKKSNRDKLPPYVTPGRTQGPVHRPVHSAQDDDLFTTVRYKGKRDSATVGVRPSSRLETSATPSLGKECQSDGTALLPQRGPVPSSLSSTMLSPRMQPPPLQAPPALSIRTSMQPPVVVTPPYSDLGSSMAHPSGQVPPQSSSLGSYPIFGAPPTLMPHSLPLTQPQITPSLAQPQITPRGGQPVGQPQAPVLAASGPTVAATTYPPGTVPQSRPGGTHQLQSGTSKSALHITEEASPNSSATAANLSLGHSATRKAPPHNSTLAPPQGGPTQLPPAAFKPPQNSAYHPSASSQTSTYYTPASSQSSTHAPATSSHGSTYQLPAASQSSSYHPPTSSQSSAYHPPASPQSCACHPPISPQSSAYHPPSSSIPPPNSFHNPAAMSALHPIATTAVHAATPMPMHPLGGSTPQVPSAATSQPLQYTTSQPLALLRTHTVHGSHPASTTSHPAGTAAHSSTVVPAGSTPHSSSPYAAGTTSRQASMGPFPPGHAPVTHPTGTGPQPAGIHQGMPAHNLGPGAHPAGTHPAGTHPLNIYPPGTYPANTHPVGTVPHSAGTHPAGTGSHPASPHLVSPVGVHPAVAPPHAPGTDSYQAGPYLAGPTGAYPAGAAAHSAGSHPAGAASHQAVSHPSSHMPHAAASASRPASPHQAGSASNPASHGPVPAGNGPITASNGPVAAGNGPIPAGIGVVQTGNGPLPAGGSNTQAAGAAAASSLAATRSGTSTIEPIQSFMDYLRMEANPIQKVPTTDVVWGQTEREKLYNFLLSVPYQLERVIWFGSACCFDSFLSVLTMLPLRCFMAMWGVLSRLCPPWRRSHGPRMRGDQVFDMLCCGIIICAAYVLRHLKPGFLYYWMKDIVSQFLKIQVLYSALELFDKILSNFGVDVLEALSGTCTMWVTGHPQRGRLTSLLADTLLALVCTLLHSAVLMCQAVVFSVAMNSKRNALLALLIASNFVEIKGTVYKRMDTTKLWNLVCMDVVERFHLSVLMLFVVVEDMDSGASWSPSPGLILECSRILGAEVVIDIIKHAVLGKFNDIRPGVYREFMRDMGDQVVRLQSHNVHRVVGFFPLGSAVLVLRILTTLYRLGHSGGGVFWTGRAVVMGVLWAAMLAVKPLLGYWLKCMSHSYVQYFTKKHGAKVSRLDKRGKSSRALKVDKTE